MTRLRLLRSHPNCLSSDYSEDSMNAYPISDSWKSLARKIKHLYQLRRLPLFNRNGQLLPIDEQFIALRHAHVRVAVFLTVDSATGHFESVRLRVDEITLLDK